MTPPPAVFLDRDGVINVSPGRGYVSAWAEFRFLPGVLAALKDLHRAGFRLFVVSNQSGVARGLYTPQALAEITARMVAAVHLAGGRLDGVFYCTHREEDQCTCRKPQPGLVERACRQHAVDRARSVVVGDDPKDMALGRTVGCRTVLVLSGRTPPEAVATLPDPPDHVCADLTAATAWILAQPRGTV